jgi:hypothetical protein
MIQRTRLACRLSKPQNCLGLDRGTHLGQRTWCRVNRPDTCSQSIRPSEFVNEALASEGPFSNRASLVNIFSLLVARWGSQSPRSEESAATSGSKYGRHDVHIWARLRRSAVHEGRSGGFDTAKFRPFPPSRQNAVSKSRWRISVHCTRDASRDSIPGCQDHHPAAIEPRPPPSDRRLTGRGARQPPRMRRRSRRWLADTADPPIGAVDRNSGLTRCGRWRAFWTIFRSGGTNCPPASPTARWRKRSIPCWSCAVMSRIFRRSSCQEASDGTDGAHRRALPDALRQSERGLPLPGAFYNRASFVNTFALLIASPGSRFSPRSEASAATSGSKYGRRDVHSGLA